MKANGHVQLETAIAEFKTFAETGIPPNGRFRLSLRELELIDGMIDVQLDHARRCDAMQNPMAIKQKGWDMERVELLRKIKEQHSG